MFCPLLSLPPATQNPGGLESNISSFSSAPQSPSFLDTRRKIAHTTPLKCELDISCQTNETASTDGSRSLYLCTRRSQGTDHWKEQAKDASSRDDGVRSMRTMRLSPGNLVGQPSRIPQMRRAHGSAITTSTRTADGAFLDCIHRYLVNFPVQQSLGRGCLPRRKNQRDFGRCISASPSASRAGRHQ